MVGSELGRRRMEGKEGKDPAGAPAEMEGLQSSRPSPFLNKTYDIVDDNSTDSLVSWSIGGQSFIVKNETEFAKKLLPKFFKTNNFTSFVRQLNIYGFGKVHQEQESKQCEFANKGFVRGQRHLLKDIRRRTPVPHHRTPQQQPQSSSLWPYVEFENFRLHSDVKRLTRDKHVLMRELVRFMQQGQADQQELQLMRQHVQVTEQRQQQIMSFLSEALQDPTFLAQLIQQNETNKRLATTHRYKRRLPEQETESDSGTFDDNIGQIVKYQPAATRAKLDVQLLRSGDLEALREDLGSAPVEQAEENGLSNRYSGVTLTTEMQVCSPESSSMESSSMESSSMSMGEIPTDLTQIGSPNLTDAAFWGQFFTVNPVLPGTPLER